MMMNRAGIGHHKRLRTDSSPVAVSSIIIVEEDYGSDEHHHQQKSEPFLHATMSADGKSSSKNLTNIKGERRYPCGYPGCRWIFTRSNHVLRHHQRVHPGYQPSNTSNNSTINNNNNSNGKYENDKLATHEVAAPAVSVAPAVASNNKTNTGSFKCDINGCDQVFKTLTLLTRHKRYVHLMISIQEQMNYIAANNNGFHSSQHPLSSTPKDPKDVDKKSSRTNINRLVNDRLSPLRLHQKPLQQQQFRLQQQSAAAKLLAVAKRAAAEAREAARDEYEPFDVPVEVVLQVDESKTWTPDCGAVDLTGLRRDTAAEKDEEPDEMEEDDEEDAIPLELVVGRKNANFEALSSTVQLQVNSISASELDDQSMSDTGKPKERPYVCDVAGCSKSYTKHSHLVRHKVETHKMAKPEPKQRGSGTNFIPPPPINLADRPFVCDYPGCRWSFKRQYHLDRHYMTHRIGKEAESSLSEQHGIESDDESELLSSPTIVTSSKSDLTNTSESSGGTSLLSPCPTKSGNVPSNKFSWPQQVKDRLVSCPACNLRFKNSIMAEQHFSMAHACSSAAVLSLFELKCPPTTPLKEKSLLMSSLSKPKACSTPDVSLANKNKPARDGSQMLRLKSEMNQRTEEKGRLFVCDIEGCDKKFGRNCELTRHKLNHMDVWPYSCDWPGCGRKFKRKDVFKNHQRTHRKDGDDQEQPTEDEVAGQPPILF